VTGRAEPPKGLGAARGHSYGDAVRVQGNLEVTSWQEDELRQIEGGGRVTRASIGYRMTGDAEGSAFSDVAMFYRPDGTAWVAGLWTVTATVGDRSGSLVFESSGEYDGTAATSRVRALRGAGTEGLADVTGEGTTTATSDRVDYDLDLQL
jgi:hypothetical protein